MEVVASIPSRFFTSGATTRTSTTSTSRATPLTTTRALTSSIRASSSLSTKLISPYIGGSCDFSSPKIRLAPLNPSSSSRGKRSVVTMSSCSYVRAPILTLRVGNAWGEAALLLAAGSKGNRSALPSSTIMMKQPIGRFRGQVTDMNIMRDEVTTVKETLVKLFAQHMRKTVEQITEDIRRPKYFSPAEAVEYGIIDKVLYNERATEDRGVISELKNAQRN